MNRDLTLISIVANFNDHVVRNDAHIHGFYQYLLVPKQAWMTQNMPSWQQNAKIPLDILPDAFMCRNEVHFLYTNLIAERVDKYCIFGVNTINQEETQVSLFPLEFKTKSGEQIRIDESSIIEEQLRMFRSFLDPGIPKLQAQIHS